MKLTLQIAIAPVIVMIAIFVHFGGAPKFSFWIGGVGTSWICFIFEGERKNTWCILHWAFIVGQTCVATKADLCWQQNKEQTKFCHFGSDYFSFTITIVLLVWEDSGSPRNFWCTNQFLSCVFYMGLSIKYLFWTNEVSFEQVDFFKL